MERGEPISYMTLRPGTPVVSSDGQPIGKLVRVLGDQQRDIFDGIVIKGDHGQRFIDADHIGALYEQQVTLRLDGDACSELPEPTATPAVMKAGPDDMVPGGGAQQKLRRVWDRLSGKS